MAHVPRLYCPGRLSPGVLVLDREQSRRLAGVMRLRPGDAFRCFSGDGREYNATVTAVAKDACRAEVGELLRQAPAPDLSVELWIGLVRPNRFDWAVEKCVEAGADVIRPLVSEHSARGDGASATRHDRWQRIVVEAAEQCGRLFLPVVEAPVTWDDALPRLDAPLLLGDAAGRSWTSAAPLLPERGQLTVAIGPEGGFSPAETAAAAAKGALFVSFGPHTLRTETAAVAATALLRSLAR